MWSFGSELCVHLLVCRSALKPARCTVAVCAATPSCKLSLASHITWAQGDFHNTCLQASAEGDDDDVHDMDLDDAVIKPDARPTPTNNTSTNQSHTSQSTERLNALVPLNKLQPNLQDVVVCGTVSGLRCVRGCLLHGRALVGWIKDDTGAVAALHMEVYNSSKVQGKTVGH